MVRIGASVAVSESGMTVSNGRITPSDVWPNGDCPHSQAVVDEIFAVAKSLTAEEVRRALPSSALAPWYQPYVVAESMMINGAKKAGDAQAQAIRQLQAEVGQLRSELAAVRKDLRVVVRSDGCFTDIIPQAIGKMASDVRRDMSAEIAKKQAETKAWTQERLGVLDQRIDSLPPPRDGLPGVPGPAGRDGAPGAPGIDGLGFDDLEVARTGDREVVFKFARGDRVRQFPIALPAVFYRDVYKTGAQYQRGDLATYAGCIWHCNSPTAEKPGAGSKAWTLAVKAGRDGRDGKNGEKGERGPEGRPGRDFTLGQKP
jgi:hypothetical protein